MKETPIKPPVVHNFVHSTHKRSFDCSVVLTKKDEEQSLSLFTSVGLVSIICSEYHIAAVIR